MRDVIGMAVVVAALSGPVCTTPPAGPDPEKIELGVKVYARERCRTCHSIEGEGNRRYPLDGVGSRLTRDEIRTWIVAPREMDPKVRKRAYDRLSAEDLDGLLAYLQSLTDPE